MRRRMFILALALVVGVGAGGCLGRSPAGSTATGGSAGPTAPASQQAATAPGEAAGTAPAPSGAESGGEAAATETNRPVPQGAVRYAVVAAESSVAYVAQETFANRAGLVTAVGRTSDITGDLVLNPRTGSLAGGTVRADLRTLTSDSPRRDRALRGRYLESERYPYATFTLAPVELGPLNPGSKQEAELAGTLEVHGTQRPVVFRATLTLEGERLAIDAIADVKMSDFGIAPPNIAGILTVEDPMQIEVHLVARAE